MQSFVVAFDEQVQNTEKSKASIVEVVSCFAIGKARIQVRRSDIHISSRAKSAQRKLRESKDHDSDLFISGVSELYKSCVAHLAKC